MWIFLNPGTVLFVGLQVSFPCKPCSSATLFRGESLLLANKQQHQEGELKVSPFPRSLEQLCVSLLLPPLCPGGDKTALHGNPKKHSSAAQGKRWQHLQQDDGVWE